MRRIACWLLGHRWRDLAINWRKHINLVHLSAMAGIKARCLRCNELWDDLGSPYFFGDRVDEINADWHREPLPRAEVRR